MSANFLQTEDQVRCHKCGWEGGSFSCPLRNMDNGATMVTTQNPEPVPLILPTRVCPKCDSAVVSIKKPLLYTLCEPDCQRCSGEYCDTHINDPCDCDVIDRHSDNCHG